MSDHQPGYLRLYQSGELAERHRRLQALLAPCRICPRACGVDRLAGQRGFCLTGAQAYVTAVCDHHGEEPVLSGTRGSGTVFFGGCNLRCVFCQNYQISQRPRYFWQYPIDARQLARQMVDLQNRLGVHNINFVSPSHVVPQMVEAILHAVPLGFRLPVVYNSNGYDSVEALRLLDGIVDIYLPDFKYLNNRSAAGYSKAEDYPQRVKEALQEMYRQVGELQLDERGLARKGLIIRHLILPNEQADSEEVLEWIAQHLSPRVAVSLMAQYYPTNRADRHPLIARTIHYREYLKALRTMERLGMDRGFAQHMDAPEHYLPDFEKDGHPFEKR